MKIALIGATGFVGLAILNEALERGHEVIGIARHPEKVAVKHPNLTLTEVDIFEGEQLTKAIKGSDIVISAYNPGWENPNIYDDFLKGYDVIQESVKKAGVERFLVIGGGGSLFVAPEVQVVDTPQFPEAWKPGAQAARDYLNIIKEENELNWTFFSPALEMHQGTSGVKKGTYRTGLDNPVMDENGKSVLSVEDLAVAILDEAENPKHSRQRFTAAY